MRIDGIGSWTKSDGWGWMGNEPNGGAGRKSTKWGVGRGNNRMGEEGWIKI